ncbi:MAG TPA: energy transducer TonB [Gammaproteobacteria bacterium]|nr:energy transducer TonB [Gammaproteobacteria bacterium]
MKNYKRVFLVFCGALLAAGVAAQEPTPPPTLGEVYIPAEAILRKAPNYPGRALGVGREGWAKVSFIISEEGEVIAPMIEDSSHPDFDEPTLQAIEKWRYKPATLDGKPVEQSMVQTIIRYQLEGGGGAGTGAGATTKFIKKYREIYDLIVAKNLAEADPLLQALEEGQLNFYEQAWLWWMKYVYLDATGTAAPSALEQALRKALGSSENAFDDYLQPDVYVQAFQRLFVVRARSGDVSGAVMAYEQLKASQTAKKSKHYAEVIASLEPIHSELMGVVKGPEILRQAARVEENDYWVHRMLRRSFAIGDVQSGKLDVVDVRCTRHNRRFASLPRDAVLKIPDSWGDCGVYIKGDVGTTFAFEEYPDSYASAADPAPVAPTKE